MSSLAPTSRNAPQTSKRIASETKRLLSDLFQSQPSFDLSVDQLMRPNYKLIETIVVRLITETGLLRDVYNANDFELNHSSQSQSNHSATSKAPLQTADKLKLKRVQFVQKLINYAANNEQPVVGCVAAKLVAGLEPTKCNELLQALARLAQKRLVAGHAKRGSSGGSSSAGVRQRTFTRSTPVAPKQVATAANRPVVARKAAAAAAAAATTSPLASKRNSTGAQTTASRRSSGTGRAADEAPASSERAAEESPSVASKPTVAARPSTPPSRLAASPATLAPTAAPKSAQDELKSLETSLAKVADLGEAIRVNLGQALVAT